MELEPQVQNHIRELKQIADQNGDSDHKDLLKKALEFEAPQIPDRVFFRIRDVSEIVGVKAYVLRYWESEFPMLTPEKSNSGQRVYKRKDVETLLLIKYLLYSERYSIEGARNRIKELRKGGKIETFKREKVLGGEQHLQTVEQLKSIKKLVSEIRSLSQVPMHDFFRD